MKYRFRAIVDAVQFLPEKPWPKEVIDAKPTHDGGYVEVKISNLGASYKMFVIPPYLMVEGPDGAFKPVHIEPGDWIVYLEGRPKIFKPEMFEAQFIPEVG